MVLAETKLVTTEDIIIGDELAYFVKNKMFKNF